MRNTYLAVGIIVVVLVVLAFVFIRSRLPQFNREAEAPTPTPVVAVQNEAVSLGQHTPARTAVVDSVTLTKSGFVTIHEAQDGDPGQILGTSLLLEAGTHENIVIELSRKTVAGETLFAQIYIDNGDGAFDANSDQLVKDKDGNVIKVAFQVAVETSGFQIPATGLGEDSY